MLVATKFRSRLMSVECKIAKCWLWMDGSLSYIFPLHYVFTFQLCLGFLSPFALFKRRACAALFNSCSVSHHFRRLFHISSTRKLRASERWCSLSLVFVVRVMCVSTIWLISWPANGRASGPEGLEKWLADFFHAIHHRVQRQTQHTTMSLPDTFHSATMASLQFMFVVVFSTLPPVFISIDCRSVPVSLRLDPPLLCRVKPLIKIVCMCTSLNHLKANFLFCSNAIAVHVPEQADLNPVDGHSLNQNNPFGIEQKRG